MSVNNAIARHHSSVKELEKFKFTSYNVLSSHLCEPTYFTSCNPDWLSPAHRFDKLQQKLELEMKENAIISLQEVSHLWCGKLHAFFASNGYYFVPTSYGHKFNGYMGVGIAVPLAEYHIEDVDIVRVADTKKTPKKQRLGVVQNFIVQVQRFFQQLGSLIGVYKKIESMWDNVLKRHNQMVCLRLHSRATGKSFVVGTYHMPCMFKKPSVMVTHCALSAQYIQKFAKGDPFVFMGDFNIKPKSSQYELLTQGDLEENHPDYPVPMDESDTWIPAVKPPLRSAYVTHSPTKTEPDFTNYAKIRDDETFIETLDYIFHSDHWDVTAVRELPHRDTVPGPLPIEDEPSDHILISADMTLK